MSLLTDSIFLIKLVDDTGTVVEFGTGFVIHRDSQYTYILTCAHVINYPTTPYHIQTQDCALEVVAAGSLDEVDLAVLRTSALRDAPILTLQPLAAAGDQPTCITEGFQHAGNFYLSRPLDIGLGNQILLESSGGKRILAWDLNILSEDGLQQGYSGSPIVRQGTTGVIGVVSYRLRAGKRGIAISIDNLAAIWPQIPAGLLNAPDAGSPQPAPRRAAATKYDAMCLVELMAASLSLDDLRTVCLYLRNNYPIFKNTTVDNLHGAGPDAKSLSLFELAELRKGIAELVEGLRYCLPHLADDLDRCSADKT